jgi:hypothetical protein
MKWVIVEDKREEKEYAYESFQMEKKNKEIFWEANK